MLTVCPWFNTLPLHCLSRYFYFLSDHSNIICQIIVIYFSWSLFDVYFYTRLSLFFSTDITCMELDPQVHIWRGSTPIVLDIEVNKLIDDVMQFFGSWDHCHLRKCRQSVNLFIFIWWICLLMYFKIDSVAWFGANEYWE